MEDHTQRNLDDLRKAAQIQLEKQKEQQESEENNVQTDNSYEDPYAEIRAEMEESDNQSENNIQFSEGLDENPNLVIKPLEDNDVAIPDIDYGEEAIYPGGPTQSLIDTWKMKYANSTILHTKILERHFVFRTMNRYEYKQIIAINNLDSITREELICKTCTLWPINYNFKAMAKDDSGYPGTLAQIIMESSGFTSEYGIEVL